MPTPVVFNHNGHKLCRGRTHPEGGAFVHPAKFYRHKNGNLFSVCIPCRNVLLGRDPDAGQASWAEAWPVFSALIHELGSKAAVARRLGRHRGFLSEMERYHSVKRKFLQEAEALLAEITKDKPRYRVGEAEVVRGADLSKVLNRWVVKYLKEHPSTNDDPSWRGAVSHFGPMQWLSHKTEINVRRISGINSGEFEYVPLSQADKLLTAIGQTDSFYNGDVEIIPNPNWRREWYQRHMEDAGCG